MWYVYCLENHSKGFLYFGYTSDLKRRLEEHNSGESKSTRPYIPLTLEAYIAVPSKQKGLSLEKYLKSGSGKVILKKRILQSKASA